MNNPGTNPTTYRATATTSTDSGFSEIFKSKANNDDLLANFPIEPSLANGAPKWTNWDAWAKMYQVYTVIKVYYKLTIHHPQNANDNGAVIITHQQSRTASDNDENKTIQDGNLYQYLGLENHRKYSVGPGVVDGADKGSFTIIEGTYKPGMYKRNVINDTDVKTWNKISDTPDLIDELWVGFFHDPLRWNNRAQHLNCSLEMKAVVQFKDLVEAFRYPAGQSSAINLTTPADFRHYTATLPAFFNSAT